MLFSDNNELMLQICTGTHAGLHVNSSFLLSLILTKTEFCKQTLVKMPQYKIY
jgi:hypothetical protein